MIGSVTSLLAGHLATGGVFMTAVLSWTNDLPPKFLRFCTAAAALAAVFAALVAWNEAWPHRAVWLGVAVAAGLWHVALRKGRGSGKGAAIAAATIALVAMVLFGLASSERGEALAVAGAVSSSLLLGAVTVTMILGHWYLVDTQLSIAPLRDGARWCWIAVALRWIAVGLVLAYGGWEVLRVSRAADLVFSTTGLFFLFRSLMGLAAPLLLVVLIWQTVKMRSTQSATGLLYVALILVLFGELVSHFLLVMTGFPL